MDRADVRRLRPHGRRALHRRAFVGRVGVGVDEDDGQRLRALRQQRPAAPRHHPRAASTACRIAPVGQCARRPSRPEAALGDGRRSRPTRPRCASGAPGVIIQHSRSPRWRSADRRAVAARAGAFGPNRVPCTMAAEVRDVSREDGRALEESPRLCVAAVRGTLAVRNAPVAYVEIREVGEGAAEHRRRPGCGRGRSGESRGRLIGSSSFPLGKEWLAQPRRMGRAGRASAQHEQVCLGRFSTVQGAAAGVPLRGNATARAHPSVLPLRPAIHLPYREGGACARHRATSTQPCGSFGPPSTVPRASTGTPYAAHARRPRHPRARFANVAGYAAGCAEGSPQPPPPGFSSATRPRHAPMARTPVTFEIEGDGCHRPVPRRPRRKAVHRRRRARPRRRRVEYFPPARHSSDTSRPLGHANRSRRSRRPQPRCSPRRAESGRTPIA